MPTRGLTRWPSAWRAASTWMPSGTRSRWTRWVLRGRSLLRCELPAGAASRQRALPALAAALLGALWATLGHQRPAACGHRRCLQALVLMPARLRVPLPCPDLPELVLGCIAAVQQHESASRQVGLSQLLEPGLTECGVDPQSVAGDAAQGRSSGAEAKYGRGCRGSCVPLHAAPASPRAARRAPGPPLCECARRLPASP